MALPDLFLRLIHVLVAAGWLGSTYYSLMVLHPKSKLLFEDEMDFEHHITALSDGNRWRLLSAMIATLISGLGLVALNISHLNNPLWLGLIVTKVIVFMIVILIFYYVSWHLWPARLFATRDEYAFFQKRGTILRACSLLLVGLDMALGVILHTIAS